MSQNCKLTNLFQYPQNVSAIKVICDVLKKTEWSFEDDGRGNPSVSAGGC